LIYYRKNLNDLIADVHPGSLVTIATKDNNILEFEVALNFALDGNEHATI
jgi:hypothetical protein